MTNDIETDEILNVIRIDEARIKDHLGEMVRRTVEEALNAMLDAEAGRLCGAGRCERSEGRQDTRAGSYERAPHTKAAEVKLKMPKLRRQTPDRSPGPGQALRDSHYRTVSAPGKHRRGSLVQV
ncbi:hypothetical protein GCM10011316_36560 [Roseibium aquae]|uniref:Mutator family transposase n=1 Tax=Roseibium aquae TaxID=1323746 RepID=A0A916X2F4_9HYPH|nr:transposase [Roseibium aquae]GGB61258.1 hypothetical protein GCM10011316_36560 [Roseibium aquae]